MLPEHGRPTYPTPAPLNCRIEKQTRRFFFGRCPLHSLSSSRGLCPTEVALSTSALKACLSLPEQRGAKGNLTNCRKTKLPNPKLTTEEGNEELQSQLSRAQGSLGICFKSPYLLHRNRGSEKGRHLPQVTQQAWMISMKCLRVEGLEL